MFLNDLLKKLFKRNAKKDAQIETITEQQAAEEEAESSGDPFEDDDIPEEALADIEDMFKKMDDDIDLKQSQSVLNLGIENDDEALKELIKNAEVDPITLTSSQSFINEASLFDAEKGIIKMEDAILTERKGFIKAEPDEPMNLLTKILHITSTHPHITISVIGAVILALIIFAVSFTFYTNHKINSIQGGDVITVEFPQSTTNDTNYVYVNRQALFDDRPIIIQKMTIDQLATVFYLEQAVELSKYDITLVDNHDKTYCMEYHVQNLLTDSISSTIWFPALNGNVKEFSMYIFNKEKMQTAVFRFILSNPVTYPSSRFYNDSLILTEEESGPVLALENASFSSAVSTINYRISWQRESEKLIQQNNKGDASIELYSGGQRILQADSHTIQSLFADEKSILGRFDFGPVKNLDSPLRITFKNLYKIYTLDRNIPAADLFMNEPENEISISLQNDYDLKLERMGWQGSYLVLVFHTEDKNKKRTEVDMDADLLIYTNDGLLEFKGDCMSGINGSDVLFDTSEYENVAYKASTSNVFLRINSALVKHPNISVPIEPVKKGLSKERNALTSFIKDSFEKRLSYKSGELTQSELTGFSEKIMKRRSLMDFYTPKNEANKTIYAAHIISYSINKDHALAYVQEIWKSVDTKGLITEEYIRSHQVKVQIDRNEYSIVSDEVMD